MSSKDSEASRKTRTYTMTPCYDENHHWDSSTRCLCVGIIATERPVNRIHQGNHPLGGNGIWRENFAGLTKVPRREGHLCYLGDMLNIRSSREALSLLGVTFSVSMPRPMEAEAGCPIVPAVHLEDAQGIQGEGDACSTYSGMCTSQGGKKSP